MNSKPLICVAGDDQSEYVYVSACIGHFFINGSTSAITRQLQIKKGRNSDSVHLYLLPYQ